MKEIIKHKWVGKKLDFFSTCLERCHPCNFIVQLCRATLSHDRVAVCNCACFTLRQIA